MLMVRNKAHDRTRTNVFRFAAERLTAWLHVHNKPPTGIEPVSPDILNKHIAMYLFYKTSILPLNYSGIIKLF